MTWLLILSAAVQTAEPPVVAPRPEQRTLIVAVGVHGTPDYGRQFQKWAGRWTDSAKKGGVRVVEVGLKASPETSDRQLLHQALLREQNLARGELWLVLIGHGTFDGKTAKFNLRGPDVSAAELADWLRPVRRPLVVINCTSSSGPFLAKLSGIGRDGSARAVMTATKNGAEQNFARLGGFLSHAISDRSADLDKDGQTSLLEAWLVASRRTAEFYESQGRLATEHSLLDDTQDGRAVRADMFRGVRPHQVPVSGGQVDGFRTHQFHLIRSPAERTLSPELRRRRDTLELAVYELRNKKGELDAAAYYAELELLLVELAQLYESAEPPQRTGSADQRTESAEEGPQS